MGSSLTDGRRSLTQALIRMKEAEYLLMDSDVRDSLGEQHWMELVKVVQNGRRGVEVSVQIVGDAGDSDIESSVLNLFEDD